VARQGRPSALLTAADAVDRAVALLCQAVILLTGVALMGVLTANVVARYVLATGGFDWAEEVPEQLFPWFIMAGVALAVQHGGHIAVEWLMGKLGRAGQRRVLLAGHVLVVLAYALLCWQSLVVADIVSIELSPALRLPRTYGYWAIAAGCALLALGTVTNAIRVALLGPEAMPQPSPEEMPT
jgi:TRAP-type transport system small permease protein